jgi:hypothetical protein
MRFRKPPSFAHWTLTHLMPGEPDEALAGDLHEEFRAGRSSAWYRRQVLSALLIRSSHELLSHRIIVLFALFWSMLAPAWLVAVARLETSAHLSARLSRFNWPWPILCDLGLLLVSNLVFIGLGVFLYLCPEAWAKRRPNFCALKRAVAASLPVLIALWVALLVLPSHYLAVHSADFYFATEARPLASPAWVIRFEQRRPGPESWRIEEPRNNNPDTHPIDPRQAVTDLGNAAILARLPFFLVILCTLWSAPPRPGHAVN